LNQLDQPSIPALVFPRGQNIVEKHWEPASAITASVNPAKQRGMVVVGDIGPLRKSASGCDTTLYRHAERVTTPAALPNPECVCTRAASSLPQRGSTSRGTFCVSLGDRDLCCQSVRVETSKVVQGSDRCPGECCRTPSSVPRNVESRRGRSSGPRWQSCPRGK
jgi:hypothetical protein